MRILLVNKFSGLEGEVGGATRYILELFDLLTSKGHDVAFFSVEPLSHQPTARDKAFDLWRTYWISGVQTRRVEFSWQGIRTAFRFLWSFEAARNMKRIVRDFRPDIVHLNSFSQQISPSILPVIKKSGVPMVMTVHDYELIYPDYALKADQWKAVEQKNYWNVVKRRDIKGSFVASFWKWIQFSFHRKLGVYRLIDQMICPSEFMRATLSREGFRSCRVLANCVPQRHVENYAQRTKDRDSILFFGRMSPEKGVLELLEAFRRLVERKSTEKNLVLVGNGMGKEIESYLQTHRLRHRVSVFPFNGVEPLDAYERSALVVVPSFPYLENYPYAVLNAFQMGLPVVASGLGGIPEMVIDNVTGWNVLGPTENVGRETYIKRLSVTLERALQVPEDELVRMGKKGYEYVSKLNPDWYYGELMKIYNPVIRGNPKLQIPISK